MESCNDIHGIVLTSVSITAHLEDESMLSGEVNPIPEIVGVVELGNCPSFPSYEGGYNFTPTGQVQILPTANTIVEQDIVIDPIPSNYGLITWNGSVLTVS